MTDAAISTSTPVSGGNIVGKAGKSLNRSKRFQLTNYALAVIAVLASAGIMALGLVHYQTLIVHKVTNIVYTESDPGLRAMLFPYAMLASLLLLVAALLAQRGYMGRVIDMGMSLLVAVMYAFVFAFILQAIAEQNVRGSGQDAYLDGWLQHHYNVASSDTLPEKSGTWYVLDAHGVKQTFEYVTQAQGFTVKYVGSQH